MQLYECLWAHFSLPNTECAHFLQTLWVMPIQPKNPCLVIIFPMNFKRINDGEECTVLAFVIRAFFANIISVYQYTCITVISMRLLKQQLISSIKLMLVCDGNMLVVICENPIYSPGRFTKLLGLYWLISGTHWEGSMLLS